MRAYFFGNMYLSSIQQGIQAGHVIADMFVQYNIAQTYQEKNKMLYEWAEEHKTMILLNGGYSENIRRLGYFLNADENPYPWTLFCEGEDSLDGALTCAGVVLPDKIYEGAHALRCDALTANSLKATNTITSEDGVKSYSKWEQELMHRLNKFNLAS